MAELAEQMTTRFRIPVIGGVAAAVAFCEALRRNGADSIRTAPETLAAP
jgi:Asp/Glu/hydantoin racemase